MSYDYYEGVDLHAYIMNNDDAFNSPKKLKINKIKFDDDALNDEKEENTMMIS